MASSNGRKPLQAKRRIPNPPTAGRKICTHAEHKGSRWLPVLYFATLGRNYDGTPKRLSSWCKTCEYRHDRQRVAVSEEVREQKRAYAREYSRVRRRAEGIQPRWPEREPKPQPKEGNSSSFTFVPAGPFLEWLDEWTAKQQEIHEAHSNGRNGHHAANLRDLAEVAGTSDRMFRTARQRGTIQLGIVDAVLVCAGGPDLWELGY